MREISFHHKSSDGLFTSVSCFFMPWFIPKNATVDGENDAGAVYVYEIPGMSKHLVGNCAIFDVSSEEVIQTFDVFIL